MCLFSGTLDEGAERGFFLIFQQLEHTVTISIIMLYFVNNLLIIIGIKTVSNLYFVLISWIKVWGSLVFFFFLGNKAEPQIIMVGVGICMHIQHLISKPNFNYQLATFPTIIKQQIPLIILTLKPHLWY